MTSYPLNKLRNQNVDNFQENFQENKTLKQAARRLLLLAADSSVLRHQSRFFSIFRKKRTSERPESDFYKDLGHVGNRCIHRLTFGAISVVTRATLITPLVRVHLN